MSLATGPAEAWLPRPYSQLLRGPNYRWWRPLLSLAIVAGALAALVLFFVVLTAAVGLASGLDVTTDEAAMSAWQNTPPGLLIINLVLAGLIVVAQLGVWGGFGWRPRWVSSVVGGLRWPWMLRATMVIGLVMVVINTAFLLWDGGLSLDPEPQLGWYLLVVLLTTPLQSAGEEYLFRGWLSQTVGAWFAHPVVGAAIAAVISATLFALAHGAQNPWLWLDRFAFGLLASWLVWRTGGLEAGIAMHAVNNVIAIGIAVLTGQMDSALDVTEAAPSVVLVDIGLFVLVGFLVDQYARRSGVVRTFRPPIRAWG